MPDRAGQPTQIQLHMTLDQLLGGQAGTGGGQRGTGSQPETPGGQPKTGAGQLGTGEVVRRILFPTIDDLSRPQPDGWTGPGALATAGDLCDASIVPIVTGHVDHELLDKLAATLLGEACGPGTQSGMAGEGATEGGSANTAPLRAPYPKELIPRN